jgi:hypothetical protein
LLFLVHGLVMSSTDTLDYLRLLGNMAWYKPRALELAMPACRMMMSKVGIIAAAVGLRPHCIYARATIQHFERYKMYMYVNYTMILQRNPRSM